jgi:hypothetical protein
MTIELKQFASRVDEECKNRTTFSPFVPFVGKSGTYTLKAVQQPLMQIRGGKPFDVLMTEEGFYVSVGTLTGERSVTLTDLNRDEKLITVKTLFADGKDVAKFLEAHVDRKVDIVCQSTIKFYEGGMFTSKQVIISATWADDNVEDDNSLRM